MSSECLEQRKTVQYCYLAWPGACRLSQSGSLPRPSRSHRARTPSLRSGKAPELPGGLTWGGKRMTLQPWLLSYTEHARSRAALCSAVRRDSPVLCRGSRTWLGGFGLRRVCVHGIELVGAQGLRFLALHGLNVPVLAGLQEEGGVCCGLLFHDLSAVEGVFLRGISHGHHSSTMVAH